MNLFIGYDVDDDPISVLIADSREKVDIAWAGMKDTPHRVEEIRLDTLSKDKGIHGVIFLLTSQRMSSRDFDHRVGGFEFRKMKRGL